MRTTAVKRALHVSPFLVSAWCLPLSSMLPTDCCLCPLTNELPALLHARGEPPHNERALNPNPHPTAHLVCGRVAAKHAAIVQVVRVVG
jgi:hypothetical protein